MRIWKSAFSWFPRDKIVVMTKWPHDIEKTGQQVVDGFRFQETIHEIVAFLQAVSFVRIQLIGETYETSNSQ